MTSLTYDEITTNKPEKSFTVRLSKKGGRNNQGVITTRHHGGGHKRLYRIIDFKRNKDDMPATVIGIEYDPNRSSNIALIEYADGTIDYMTTLFAHANDVSNLFVGKVIKRGEVFYKEGTKVH